MTAQSRERLMQLQTLAQMVLDAGLADLRAAARARDESLAHLAHLNRSFEQSDLHPMAAAEAEIRFQRWADQRRAEVNQALAQQTVYLEEKRKAARLAFGRTSALAALRDKQI